MNVYSISDQNNKTSAAKTNSVNSLADTNVFLKLLTTELCNQDPTNPTDGTEYISQLAQFTSLQQTQEINESIKTLLLSKDLSSGTSMIGKEVLIKLDESNAISDIVKGIRISDNKVYIATDSGYYSLDDVIGVGSTQIEEV
jgi:flagellar basal-body rod modification protein FlgD